MDIVTDGEIRRESYPNGSVALAEPGRVVSGSAARRVSSEEVRELVEGDADSTDCWHLGGEFVVATAEVLHEGVPGREGAR